MRQSVSRFIHQLLFRIRSSRVMEKLHNFRAFMLLIIVHVSHGATDCRLINNQNMQLQATRGATPGQPVRLVTGISSERLQIWTIQDWDSFFSGIGTTILATGVTEYPMILDEDVGSSKVITWGDGGGVNQRWTAQQVGEKYQIVNKRTLRCLVATSTGSVTVACNKLDASQLWTIQVEGTIRNVGTNLYLDVQSTQQNGNRVQLKPWSGVITQQWAADYGPALGWGSYFQTKDQIGTSSNLVMDEDFATKVVHVWNNNGQDSRKWYITRVGSLYLIKNILSNNCLTPDSNRLLMSSPCNPNDQNQQWDINSFVVWRPQETFSNMKRIYLSDEVAVYVSSNIDSSSVSWLFPFYDDIWRNTKRVYGNFGPDPFLRVFLTKTNSGSVCTPGVFADGDQQNAIRCTGNFDMTPGQGYLTDASIHELSHNVENFANGVCYSPSWGIWKDSMWAPIFIYDTYLNLNNQTWAQAAYNEFSRQIVDYPNAGSDWWNKWWMPIYTRYGGTKVLQTFFKLLAANVPKKGNCYNYQLNIGEFVWFWTGAAQGASLTSFAADAFKLQPGWLDQYEAAKLKFPVGFP